MIKLAQSCLAVMVAVGMALHPHSVLGETEISADPPKVASETLSPLLQADKEALQERVMGMIQALNNFDYEQFCHFFSEDSLKLLKHQVQGYSANQLFELIFPEGRSRASELSARQFFIRIVAKSRFNVGISRPYDTNTAPRFNIRADDGDMATVMATFADAHSGYQTRSETFTFKKVDNQWLGEAPDFILSDFKYDLLRNFISTRRFYPLYPLTDTFRIMLRSWQPLG